MAIKMHKQQRGQSMVEYIVVVGALAMALLAPGLGSNESLRQAVVNQQNGYSYAISLSDIPETDDLTELANYYDSLEKYPELANDLRGGDQAMKDFADKYMETTGALKDFKSPLPDKPPSYQEVLNYFF
jgi:hypothetical protein